MYWRIGLIATEGAGPLANAGKHALRGAKRAFTMAGGHIDEQAAVFAIPTEPIVRAARITGTVLWHLGNARLALADARRDENLEARDETGVGFDRAGAPALQSLPDGEAEFGLLNERIERLTGRLESLRQRDGDAEVG